MTAPEELHSLSLSRKETAWLLNALLWQIDNSPADGPNLPELHELMGRLEFLWPYRCTFSQTGFAWGVYVNNGQNCPRDGIPLKLDGTCPKCVLKTVPE